MSITNNQLLIFVLGYLAGITSTVQFFRLYLDETFFIDKKSDNLLIPNNGNSMFSSLLSPSSNQRLPTSDDWTQPGWKAIQVFYGQKVTKGIPPTYSAPQAAQDKIVAGLFRNQSKGYFVDLAANDAIDMSNTYGLERQLNWGGLCIEANPINWRNLTHYRDCQVVGAAVGKDRMGMMSFEMEKWAGVGGGFVGSRFDNPDSKSAKSAVDVYTVPLVEILDNAYSPKVIDYVSLDVEGAEDYIISIFPFEKYIFKVMTVERPKQKFYSIMQQNGYKCVATIAKFGETLWIHKSYEKELDMDSVKMNAVFLYPCREVK